MNRIRELAEIRDISQKQLALDLDLAQSTLSDWMNQKKDPKGENLQKIANYFGVNPMVVKGLAPVPEDYAAESWSYDDYETQGVLLRTQPRQTPSVDIAELARKVAEYQNNQPAITEQEKIVLDDYRLLTNEEKYRVRKLIASLLDKRFE